MKKGFGILLALMLLCAASLALADVPINEEKFPDPIFRQYVTENVDLDGNGILSEAEANQVESIICNEQGIRSLKGIEFFSRLLELSCYGNSLKELDMSGSPNLEYLSCYGNQITRLIVERNTRLHTLGCSANQLKALELPKAPYLSWLDVTSNSIKKLDVTHSPMLARAVEMVSPTPYIYWDGGYSINWIAGDYFLAVDKNVTVLSGSTPIVTPTEVTEYRNDGIAYQLNSKKKTATVSGVTDKKAKELLIPDTVKVLGKTYKVTEVKAGAFKGLKKLAKLTIGKNVKTIGSKAFYNCKKLKSIVIKTTKLTDKTVGADTFKGIDKKATIQVPSKKLKAYKTLLVQKGAPKTCKIK